MGRHSLSSTLSVHQVYWDAVHCLGLEAFLPCSCHINNLGSVFTFRKGLWRWLCLIFSDTEKEQVSNLWMNECKLCDEAGESFLGYGTLVSGQSALLLVGMFSFLYSSVLIELLLGARCQALHRCEYKECHSYPYGASSLVRQTFIKQPHKYKYKVTPVISALQERYQCPEGI